MIGVAVRSAVFAKVTATVREARLPACVPAAVVIPVAMVTVHFVFATTAAAATVSDKVAVAPEPEVAVVTVVEPQPLYEGVASVPRVKEGSTRARTSPIST
jgi:hypothetical protein